MADLSTILKLQARKDVNFVEKIVGRKLILNSSLVGDLIFYNQDVLGNIKGSYNGSVSKLVDFVDCGYPYHAPELEATIHNGEYAWVGECSKIISESDSKLLEDTSRYRRIVIDLQWIVKYIKNGSKEKLWDAITDINNHSKELSGENLIDICEDRTKLLSVLD